MKKLLLSTITAAVFAVASQSYALIASDNAGNYGGGWTNGANGGTGFLAWSISITQQPDTNNPPAYFAGNFIGDPSNSGITGLGAQAFGLYANPTNSTAFVGVGRGFSSAMVVGDTFSFQWGINYDSGTNGTKGFSIYTGGTGGTELLYVLNGNNSDISFSGNNTGFGYGTAAMTWSFSLVDATTLSVSANDRDGTGTYSTNITVAGAPDAVRFYAYQNQSNVNAQPYFNNLSVVPEPSTYALLALSAAGFAGYVARRRARK